MEYQWNEYLETGYEKIDNQHKQLIEYLNNLIDAFNGGEGINEIEKTMDFLAAYTVKHFRDEENLMIESDYPEYLLHRTYHEDFKKRVAGYIETLKNEGASNILAESLIRDMGNWLVNHIKGDDFVMAAYVKNNADKSV